MTSEERADDELVDVAEVARRLGLHANTTKRVPAKDLPFFRVNKRGDRRYRLGDVRAYLAARRVE